MKRQPQYLSEIRSTCLEEVWIFFFILSYSITSNLFSFHLRGDLCYVASPSMCIQVQFSQLITLGLFQQSQPCCTNSKVNQVYDAANSRSYVYGASSGNPINHFEMQQPYGFMLAVPHVGFCLFFYLFDHNQFSTLILFLASNLHK